MLRICDQVVLLGGAVACLSCATGQAAPTSAPSDSTALPASSAAPPQATPSEPAEAKSARPAHWSYEGPTGPGTWGELHAEYAACGQGQTQSPIDLPRAPTGSTTEVQLSYGPTGLAVAHTEHVDDIIDNGHTIQVTVDEGSTMSVQGTTYHLRQFHFHSPSEHTVDGRAFPLEVHFVHQADDGRFAVLAALVEPGGKNANFAAVLAHLPSAKGETARPEGVVLHLGEALPAVAPATTYLGSLTTPPCTEGVSWVVLEGVHVTADDEQLRAFGARLGSNHRPVQPLYGRAFGQAGVRIEK